MTDAGITLVVLAATVVMFVWNRFPVELVAIGSALALYATGVLDLTQSLAGFGDAAVILIAALFVVSEALDATGVTAYAGQRLVAAAGTRPRLLMALTMLLSAVLTALIGLNGAVAALLPMAVAVAVRMGFPPSRLLMPLAFAGSAGGLLLLIGSPVNIVISEAAQDAGVGPFALFEFALVGLPVVAGTVLLVLFFGPRLVPERHSEHLPPDLSRHAGTLVRHYGLDDVAHLRVRDGSRAVGRGRGRWDLSAYPGVKLITTTDGATGRPTSEGNLVAGDRLTLVGDIAMTERFAHDHDLVVENVRSSAQVEQSLLGRDLGAAEVVIPPRSRFVGEIAAPGQAFLGGDLVVLSVERQGIDEGAGEIRLAVGDVLLVEGRWAALEAGERDHNLLVVDSPASVRRQAVALGPGSLAASVVLVVMVVLLATRVVPPVVATLLAAGADPGDAGAVHPAGLPQRLVEHRSPGGGHDAHGHGDAGVGSRGARRRADRWARR